MYWNWSLQWQRENCCVHDTVIMLRIVHWLSGLLFYNVSVADDTEQGTCPIDAPASFDEGIFDQVTLGEMLRWLRAFWSNVSLLGFDNLCQTIDTCEENWRLLPSIFCLPQLCASWGLNYWLYISIMFHLRRFDQSMFWWWSNIFTWSLAPRARGSGPPEGD